MVNAEYYFLYKTLITPFTISFYKLTLTYKHNHTTNQTINRQLKQTHTKPKP